MNIPLLRPALFQSALQHKEKRRIKRWVGKKVCREPRRTRRTHRKILSLKWNAFCRQINYGLLLPGLDLNLHAVCVCVCVCVCVNEWVYKRERERERERDLWCMKCWYVRTRNAPAYRYRHLYWSHVPCLLVVQVLSTESRAHSFKILGRFLLLFSIVFFLFFLLLLLLFFFFLFLFLDSSRFPYLCIWAGGLRNSSSFLGFSGGNI